MRTRILTAMLAAATIAGILRAGAPLQGQASDTARTVWDGVYTEPQAAAGQQVYVDECANCHGGGLEGADVTPGLVGASFGSNWNDLTVGDLTERIRTTMPAQQPGRLARQQVADVVAFIMKSNQWPAGETPLPSSLAAQKQIRIQVYK